MEPSNNVGDHISFDATGLALNRWRGEEVRVYERAGELPDDVDTITVRGMFYPLLLEDEEGRFIVARVNLAYDVPSSLFLYEHNWGATSIEDPYRVVMTAQSGGLLAVQKVSSASGHQSSAQAPALSLPGRGGGRRPLSWGIDPAPDLKSAARRIPRDRRRTDD